MNQFSFNSVRHLLLSTMILVMASNASGQIISPSQPDVWPGGRGVAVTVHPANSNIAVVASEAGGLFKTTNAGATWTHTRLAPTGANPRIFAVNALAGGVVDACGDAGFFRSTTNGTSWGQAASGIPGCTQGAPHLIAVSPLEPNVIFVTTSPSTLFESDDGGGTWTPLNPPPPTLGVSRPSFVKTHLSADGDPTHFDIYFANAYTAVRQTCFNRGSGLRCSTSWNTITIGPNESLHDPNDITWGATGNSPRYFLSDSGFYVTADGGATFTVIGGGSAGYNALQLYDVTGQIFNDHTDLYFGTMDNCLWASSNRALSWGNARCEEGFNIQVKRRPASHANETIVGVIPGRGNFFTVPHFTNFNLWNNPLNGTGNPFVINTGVYLQYTSTSSAASGLSLTTNTGGNWNSITQPNSTTPLTIQNSLAHWPQVSGTVNNPVVYQAVTRPGTNSDGSQRFGLVRMDVNIAARTGTVTPADVSGLGSLGIYCMGQATFVCPVIWGVNPNDANHLIAPDVSDGQMKVSRDGGATWTPDAALTNLVTDSGQIPFTISQAANNTPAGVGLQVHAIGFDPDTPGRILVGTESAGIFQSLDNGQTWSKIRFSDYFIRAMTSFFLPMQGRSLFQLTVTVFGELIRAVIRRRRYVVTHRGIAESNCVI